MIADPVAGPGRSMGAQLDRLVAALRDGGANFFGLGLLLCALFVTFSLLLPGAFLRLGTMQAMMFQLPELGILSLAIFLVLPLMQTISAPPPRDLAVRGIETADLPPPPPPPPEQEEEEEKPPEPPPEMESEAPPLELSELELALNPGTGEGLFGDFQVKLVRVAPSADGKSARADARGDSVADRIFDQRLDDEVGQFRVEHVIGNIDSDVEPRADPGLFDFQIRPQKGEFLPQRFLLRGRVFERCPQQFPEPGDHAKLVVDERQAGP